MRPHQAPAGKRVPERLGLPRCEEPGDLLSARLRNCHSAPQPSPKQGRATHPGAGRPEKHDERQCCSEKSESNIKGMSVRWAAGRGGRHEPGMPGGWHRAPTLVAWACRESTPQTPCTWISELCARCFLSSPFILVLTTVLSTYVNILPSKSVATSSLVAPRGKESNHPPALPQLCFWCC